MSPRSKKQFEEMREEKMTLIMDAALEHFANEGFFRTTISHLAKHAGISKGLMYNYFENKEALLRAIIHRSVNEIYHFLNISSRENISENEFEFYIKKAGILLKEKRHFWRLFMQLLMQNEAREQFLKAYTEADLSSHPGHEPGDSFYPSEVIRMIKDYFTRKAARMPATYDPESDFEMFLLSLEGYVITSVISDENNNEKNEKIINRMIELYK